MRRIVIIFPGIGYHCDKPLLYYGRMTAKECGYEECLNLSYSFDGGNIRGNEEKMQEAFDVLYAQAEISLKKIDFSQYEDVLFISKSVGTIIASAYAQKYGIKCKNVLYTPLKHTFMFKPENAIAFIGTKDPWSKVTDVIMISEKNGTPIYTYEGADHSLESGEVSRNLDNLKDVMMKTGKFLGKEAGCQTFCVRKR